MIIQSSITPHTQFPLLTYQYDTFVTINELILIHYYYLKSIYYSDFLSFNLMSLLQDFIQDTMLLLVIMSPYIPLACDSFSDFSFLMALTVLGSTCRSLFYWDLSDIFLIVRLGLQIFGKKTEVDCHFHHFPSPVHQHDLLLFILTLINWLR